MNFNELLFRNKVRGRGRFSKSKVNSVTVQKPLMPPPKKPVSKKTNSTATFSSASTNLIWKNESSRSNVSTLVSTSTSSRSTLETESRVVIALSEGRGEAKHEVGMAAVDVSRPSLILCQISDTQSYLNTLTKINIINPDEILIPMTFVGKNNRLIEKVKEHFKQVLITAVPRATFNNTNGMQLVKELCAPQWNSVILTLQHRCYALAAASALLTYTERVLYVLYARESLKVEYQESEGYAFIDIATADRLELVASTSPTAQRKFTSLLGVLNHCLTRIGSRMLRSLILQPPCSVFDIEARLDCVAELRRNPDLMSSVQGILSKLTNVDQLLSVTTILPSQEQNHSERQLNYVLKLNVLLESIQPLISALKACKLPFLVELTNTLRCQIFKCIKDRVRELIHSDAHPAKGQQGIIQRCFAIKSDVNGLLDLVRKAYSERIEEMRDYVRNLGTKYNLPLSVTHNNKKGYHIVLMLNQRERSTFKKSSLPDEFIQVHRLSTYVTMKTLELINWSTKIDVIQVEILKISNVMIYNILLEVRSNIGLFYSLCDGIGRLDVSQSLAQASCSNGYVRPIFGDFLEVTRSRHPLLDFLCNTEPTPNTIFASDMHNVNIITGPNGSGKSIFIRQTILLQVMAQVGSFVPAESATFRVCDRILARISFDDNLDFGVSTFVLEIKEIMYFQTMMSRNTLIIIDELGRSTSVEEGTALAMAICEDLATSKAFIFFTTHFNTITRLENLYLNITNWQLHTYEETIPCGRKKLTYTYNLIRGSTNLKNYGLYCARASWPEDIVFYAETILKNSWHFKPGICVYEDDPGNRMKYNLEADLKILKLKKQLSVSNLHARLIQYVAEMNEIGWSIDISEFTLRRMRFNFHNAQNGEENVTIAELGKNNIEKECDWIFTPLNNDDRKVITERPELAARFNESIQNSYVIPEANYSQSDCGNEEGAFTDFIVDKDVLYKDILAQNCFNGGTTGSQLYQAQTPPYPTVSFSNCYAHSELVNEKIQADVSPVARNSVTSREIDVTEIILNSSQYHKTLPENTSHFDSYGNCDAGQEHGIPFGSDQVNASHDDSISNMSLYLKTKYEAKSKELIDRQNDTLTQTKFLRLSQESVADHYQFSLPLLKNVERTSTPIPSQPAMQNQSKFNLSFNSIQWQCSLRASQDRTLADSQEFHSVCKDSWSAPSHDEDESCPKAAINSDVSSAIEDLQSCSACFSQDWNEFVETHENNDGNQQQENKIHIHSMYVFDAHGRLMEQVVNNEGRQLVDDVPQETIAKKQSCQPIVQKMSVEQQNSVAQLPSQSMTWGAYVKQTYFETKINLDEVSRQSGDYKEEGNMFRRPSLTLRKSSPAQAKLSRATSTSNDDDIIETSQLSNIEIAGPSTSKRASCENLSQNEINVTETKPLDAFKSSAPTQSKTSCLQKSETASKSEDTQSCLEKTEEIQTFEDLGSRTLKTNFFAGAIDDVSFNLSPDLFSDLTTSTLASVKLQPEPVKKRNKFQTPLKKLTVESESPTIVRSIERKATSASKTKFRPPKMLTKKQIVDDFVRQDMEMMSCTDVTSLTKYHEQISNRPSVLQLQRQEHVAVLRKTGDGVEVIPVVPTATRKRKRLLLQRSDSGTNFDVTLFSDKNCDKFERFLENKKGSGSSSGGSQFRLQIEAAPVVEEKPKFQFLVYEEQEMIDKQKDDVTFTPEGYYKRNQSSIDRIVKKYLPHT